jgi:2-oxoglutarate/2-oxoacid ferredoxin oxidoreductase subunit beta
MTKADDWNTDVEIQWCPGCPNFGILQAFKLAMVELDKQPHQLCVVSGIGQAAKFPHYVKANFFNGLHGRALPAALAIHAANPDLTTIVMTGEGDCYGEGGNHFIHTLRRNPNLTLVVHNNGYYALTKGQASPTTSIGERRAIHLHGVESAPLQTLAIAIAQDCSFVARGFAGDIEHLKSLLVEGVRHEGFSYIDVIQPCITWGKRPLSWYRERVDRISTDHDPGDRRAALEMALDSGERMSIGVLYRNPRRPLFGERFRREVSGKPLASLRWPDRERIANLLAEFRRD